GARRGQRPRPHDRADLDRRARRHDRVDECARAHRLHRVPPANARGRRTIMNATSLAHAGTPAAATQDEVWVVDDDRSIRWVLEKALARDGIPHRMFASVYEV